MTQIDSEHDYVEHSIRAGMPFTMMIQSTTFGAAQTAYCTTRVRFVPEAGADYEVRFSQVPGADGGPGCKMTLERLTLDRSGKVQTTPVNREPLPACK